jgi:aminoglycoside phosphotransferase (APT) family kinase protein
MAETPKGIAAEPVTDWLVANIPDVSPPFEFALITGGHSNLTYRVTDGAGRKLVLRRPPLGAVLATAHDMGREHKIIAALAGTGVPVPPALGLCTDTAVNDAPFYVMAFVEGVVLDTSERVKEHVAADARRGLGRHVIEVLARLHGVDVDAVGLGDLGRREGYVPRQLKRWRTQWEKSKTRELPAMDAVYEALQSGIPEQEGATVVHGDYRLGNMLTGADARIAAVLDWELCTLGDPLADLGYLMNNWAEPGETGPASRGAAAAPTVVDGFPSRTEMVAHYEELTGRDASRIDYYRAFSYWRLAAIVEGVLARYLKGVMGNAADTSAFRAQVDALAEAALERVRALG